MILKLYLLSGVGCHLATKELDLEPEVLPHFIKN
jgi:hypothetical protein